MPKVDIPVKCTGYEEAKSKLKELVSLLEKANSLVGELASSGVKLELDVKM